MQRSEFSERHFELACNIELLGGATDFFAPSTNVEATLGFDASLAVANPAVWAVLTGGPPLAGGPAGPAPPPAVPPPAPGGPIPGAPPLTISVTSLFVQYKVGYHLTSTISPEGAARLTWFGAASAAPFYRVRIPRGQHETFSDWAASVAPMGASSFYAAPRFRTWADMTTHQTTGLVHAESAWLSAVSLGASLTWTFDEPNTAQMHHSTPERIEPFGLDRVAQELRRGVRIGGVEEIRNHVTALAEAIGRFDPEPDPTPTIAARYPNADGDALAVASAITRIRSAANARGIAFALLTGKGDVGAGSAGLAPPSETGSLREILRRRRGGADPAA